MIDATALSQLINVDSDNPKESFAVLQSLEQMFLTRTPKLLHQMNQGFEERNVDLIFRAAHTLKTSCGYLGLTEMVLLCNEIENWSRQATDSFFGVFDLIRKLETAYRKGVVELRNLIRDMT